MELMEDSHFRNKYEKCKKIVKIWEYNFKKKRGRVPSKHDIREADIKIRDAYRTYYRMKTSMLEESLLGSDAFSLDEDESYTEMNSSAIIDETDTICKSSQKENEEDLNSVKTWGDHLSIKIQNDTCKTEKTKENVNESFTKKLFVGSKFSKRNPRKSQSLCKSKTNILSTSTVTSSFEFTSQEFIEAVEKQEDDIKIESNVQFIHPSTQIHSHSLNIINTLINETEPKPVRSLDKGWMERVAKETETAFIQEELNTNKPNYESDEIIENSDEESSSLFLHIAKKRKFDFPIIKNVVKDCDTKQINPESSINSTISKDNLVTIDVTNCNRLDFANIFNKQNSSEQNSEKEVLKVVSDNIYDFHESVENISTKPKKGTKKSKKENVNKTRIRKSSRKSKPLVNIQKDESESEEDPFKCDSDSDPDYQEDKKKDKCHIELPEKNKIEKKKKSPAEKKNKSPAEKKNKSPAEMKRKSPGQRNRKTKKDVINETETNESENYELEYSIKPRTVTVPRFKTIPNTTENLFINKIPNASKDKQQQAKEKLELKASSGNLNDNFVRINLKKKVFARGKKTMNFSKFKKQQWKNKRKALSGPDMDMGGCDGGMLTCFKCGGEGHFARKCTAAKGDGLLPLAVAEEEICPYPTLEEASEMAKGSVLAIRKPKINTNKKNGEEKPNDNGIDKGERPKENDEKDEVIEETDEEKEKTIKDIEEDGGDCLDDSFEKELLAETIRIEDLIPKIDINPYVDNTKFVKPLYELNEDGSVIETPPEVFEALSLFSHSSFRPGQELAVMRILSGLSTLVTLSTGSGKSLCYQLPAYLYSRRQSCISLVISPLVSLMEDQVTGIPNILKAACLHTNQTKVQREKIMEQIRSNNLDILLVSPEAIVAGEKSMGFGSLLRQLPPIAFACIDEAHCVSQWSHNFRPSYLMICRVLRDRLGINTILGLTATATRATSDSIITHLQVPDGRSGIIADIPLPDNLHLNVSKDANRDHALLGLILSEKYRNLNSIIVYCTRREECERIAGFLRTALQETKISSTANEKGKKRKRNYNSQAECYHAGMSASRRKIVQKMFMSGELRIVVATVAFGMGINKSDIRGVIHYNLPRNFESYVQEVGRAGRDGLPAYCHLFLDSQGRDENELRRHIFSNSMDRHVIRKLLQKIFVKCNCDKRCPKHEVGFSIEETVRQLDISEEIISTLLCYLELHEKRFIEVLSPAYTMCKIVSYGGPNRIRKAAQECPPLAMALALRRTDSKDDNVIEFPVIDIAAAIGWDSGITKHKLKNLEWTSENNQPKRSTLTVVFSNLGFRLLAPGNLTESELDEALDSLYARVVDQEKTAMLQLHAICTTVCSVASRRFQDCYKEEPVDSSIPDQSSNAESSSLEINQQHQQRQQQQSPQNVLKSKIREYFECPKPLSMLPEIELKQVNEGQIVSDIRALVGMYRDNVFTGRAVARIFHGIQSPNYPAVIWGRCKFWRAHLSADFNTVCQIATKELIRLR